MTTKKAKNNCIANTDRELWRERKGDFYSDSIHVTESGQIGMCHEGHTIVMPIEKWHYFAQLIIEESERAIEEGKEFEINLKIKKNKKKTLANKQKPNDKIRSVNKCLTCSKFEPHIDDTASSESWKQVRNGKLAIKKENCSKWLCNNGACPNYAIPIVRAHSIE